MGDKVFKKKPFGLKFREWMADTFYTHYGTLKIFSWFHSIRYIIRYKIIRPRNVVRVKTLTRGYHDIVEVMLHANFAMLVDFVEHELLSRGKKEEDNYLDEEKERAEYLEYLEPKGSWKNEDVDMYMAASIDQNKRTREIFRLYKWWKNERPARKELEMDALTKADYEKSEFSKPIDGSENEYGEPTLYEFKIESQRIKDYFDAANKQEAQWEEEDQTNLKSLIELRRSLWT